MATFGTFAAGQVLTASELNAAGAYSAHTVTWTNVTVGNGTTVARYTKFNKLVHYWGKFTLGTTSAITGQIGIDLPVNCHASQVDTFIGVAGLQDTGVGTYPAFPLAIGADTIYIYPMGTGGAYGSLSGTSATIPFTWGNTDVIQWDLTYEAA